MALKNICSIPQEWTLADYGTHQCTDGSHQHFSRAKIKNYEEMGMVVWLKHPETNRDSGIVWIIDTPAVIDDLAARDVVDTLGSPMTTGLSFRVGEYLAKRVRQRHPWAQVMISEISGSKVLSVEF